MQYNDITILHVQGNKNEQQKKMTIITSLFEYGMS